MAERTHDWKRVAAIAFAALAAAALAILLIATLFADRWAQRAAQRLAADLTRDLQRPVRIGDVNVSVWRGRLEVTGIELGKGVHEPPGTPRALALERAVVDVGLWRTLASLGRRPHLQRVELQGVQANVVRLPDGTLNWQNVAQRLERRQPAQARREPDPRVRNTVCDEARVEGAELALVDLSGGKRAKEPATARISAIELLLRDAGYHKGFALEARAALLAAERNFELKARAGGVRERAGRAALPDLHALRLQLRPTELAPLAPFLAALAGPGSSTLEQGVVSADFDIDGKRKQTAAGGQLAISGARLRGGERFDAKLDLDLALDDAAGRIDVKHAALQLGEMSLIARGAIHDLRRTPRFERVDLRSRELRFERVQALFPDFARAAAPAVLRGPFALTATGSGSRDAQRGQLELNLTDASITVGDRFAKPARTPLVLRAELRTQRDAIEIAQLALQLAEFRVVGQGKVSGLERDAPRVAFRFDTPEPAAGSLLRLLPGVARALGDRAPPGTLAIKGKLDGREGDYTADAELQLAGLDVRTSDARFTGGGQATLSVRSKAQKIEAQASADFTQLRAVYRDVVQKPEPTPFTFEAQLSAVSGRPSTLRVSVPSFEFTAGRSDVRGSFQLANLDDPQIEVKARSRYFDLADFVPAREGAEEKKAERGKPSALAKADGRIVLSIEAGRAADTDYRDLDAKFKLRNGRATAETLEVSVWEGRVSGKGSEFPLFGQRGSYRLRGTLEGLQTQALLAQLTSAPELLRGKLGGSVDVELADATLAAVRDTLTGTLSGRVDGAAFVPGNAWSEFAGRLQAVSAAAGIEALANAAERVPSEGDWTLETLAGALRFDKGAVIIDEPLTARTPQGELSLEGRLSLGDSGDLEGNWAIEPKALEALVGHDLDLDRPVPVELEIQGPLTRPRFGFGDVEGMFEQLVGSQVKARLGDEARRRLERALGGGAFEVPSKGEEEKGGAKEAEPKKEEAEPEKEEAEPQKDVEDNVRKEIEKRLPKLF